MVIRGLCWFKFKDGDDGLCGSTIHDNGFLWWADGDAGKLKKEHIKKGYEVLKQIEQTLKDPSKKILLDLSNQFYTLIPHNFGRLVYAIRPLSRVF